MLAGEALLLFFVLRRRNGCPYFIFLQRTLQGVVFLVLRLERIAFWL
jgi:hypothetical protein